MHHGDDAPGSAATHWVVIATVLVAGGLGAWSLLGEEPAVELMALSPQACLADCQGRQTDCILACEGRVDCETRCLALGKECASGCVPKRPEEKPPQRGISGRRDAGVAPDAAVVSPGATSR